MKERYIYLEDTNQIHDKDEDYLYAFNNLEELTEKLNQQDKRIKELENSNQKKQDYYWSEINKLDELYNKDLEERLEEVEQLKQHIKELEEHALNEQEWQHYCAFKHIEPQIKGCLDRENLLIKENQQLKQSQKQLAIDTLEKVMASCKMGISDYWSLHYVCTVIENQIKNLKEKKWKKKKDI